ncbi:SDR family NAD(P)-dependent oxidoreductase [Chitinophaga sp. Cy-1792]|uniref:SDR family NAD(P)-dependent oxidoreductase n=1 Tax=Chitinophaga sp. Cy-1792 TaxID=2608339 RepID=UPI0014208067|nr:SDR family oxidoreductase [Chitinophaga sp. Cy-1792]NIG55990.1 SDR family oxidoreductase [Chitinophaga sp. Cy-1792]
MYDNNKRVAIVTGGGSGIGLAIAQKFVDNGIETIVIGRNEKKLSDAKQLLGERCHPINHDVSDLASLPSLVDNIIRDFGQIDILVNNAGINMKKDFTETTDEDFQQVINTNLTAVFSLSRAVVKHMIPQGKGSIINISSMAAQYGMPRVISYSASKAAIDGITRAMAVELSPKGIRINAIAPGFIATAMTAVALDSDPERKNKALGRTPMGHLGQPSDIGDAALFLCSDAAKYITGVILPVDGGNSIGF